MQEKAKKNNKNRHSAVQNVVDFNNTKTLQSQKLENIKASRAKFACNQKLAEFIDIANLLPYDEDENLRVILKSLHILPSSDVFLSTNNILENFKLEEAALKSLSAEVNIYIQQRLREYEPTILKEVEELSSDNYLLIEGYYWSSKILYSSAIVKELYLIRKTFLNLLEIAHFFEIQEKRKENLFGGRIYVPRFYEPELNSWRKYVDFIPNDNREFLITPNRSVGEMIGISDVDFDEEGNIKFRLSPLAEALQGVNISRIRRCEICGKIFWAARKDAFTCSKQHANTRRMRLLRESWKDKGVLYLKARQKKANKRKENKQNGSL